MGEAQIECGFRVDSFRNLPCIAVSRSGPLLNVDSLHSYDYELPEALIAQFPAKERTAARLLVLDRQTSEIAHRHIGSFPEFLNAGDCLVFNNTKVIPAQLHGFRTETGGKWEGLFLEIDSSGNWLLMGQTRGKLQAEETLTIVNSPLTNSSAERLLLELIEKNDEGIWRARPQSDCDYLALLDRFGHVPLPHYIKRKEPHPDDVERYQTVFAKQPGAVAAPTAGLHFTNELLDNCKNRGIEIAELTLHVGIGTFRPISCEDLSQHVMHSERYEISQQTVDTIRQTKHAGKRVVAVGTTTVRTLESVARDGELQAGRGETDIFIRPSYEFQVIDGLLTNFHLPKSSLLVMVSAFAGRESTRKAYQSAIDERYRFFSYGDAMLIL